MQIERWQIGLAAAGIVYYWVSAHRRTRKDGSQYWDYQSGRMETNRRPDEVARDFERLHRSANSNVDIHKTKRGFVATVADFLGGLFHIEVKAERRTKN